MGNIEHPTSNSEHRKGLHQLSVPLGNQRKSWGSEEIACEPPAHETLRFFLMKPGTNLLAIVGLNPSTANESLPDPTMNSVRRLMASFPSSEGPYDGFLMVNLYPLRTSKPENLPRTQDASLAKENLRQIEKSFKNHKVRTVWAAWGNNIVSRHYHGNNLKGLASLSIALGLQWKSCGERTKSGHPRHPLYLKTGTPLSHFNMENYLSRLA